LSLRVSPEKRMAIHIAALCQKSLSYDEFTRRALEQERIAQQKSIIDAPTERRTSSEEASVAFRLHPMLSAARELGITGDKDNRLRRHPISRACKQKKSLRQRLAHVANVWDELQETRNRDAVYDYLRAVFSIVKHYRGRRRTKKLVRRAFRFAGLPIDMNADPFAVVMRCTCEKKLDRKTISKWSRALRYAARSKKPRVRLIPFMRKRGGITGCAALYAEQFGRGKR
jgi:hypothetical protein